MTLQEELRTDEGEILHAYYDSEGYITIGVGVCIDSKVGCGITTAESDYLLGNRLSASNAELSRAFPWTATLGSPRMIALQNLAYNLGIKRLSLFHKFLAALEAGDYVTAKAELLNSAAAKQEPARIQRLAERILTGEWATGIPRASAILPNSGGTETTPL